MGVIDLDARVKKLEQDGTGGAVIDQLEAAVTALEEAAVPSKTDVTELDHGEIADSTTGGVYYEVMGNLVHVHVAALSFTANTRTTAFVLPEAIRPVTPIFNAVYATQIDSNKYPGFVIIGANGNVDVITPTGSVFADITYLLTPATPTP